MVSTVQIAGMILAIVIPLTVYALIFVHTKRSLKTKGLIATGLYGFFGFGWQIMLYVMFFGWLNAALAATPWYETEFSGQVTKQFIISVFFALFTAASMFWAVYLSNMRERLLSRAVTVGLGFGIAYTIWNFIIVYARPLYYAFQIRAGTFTGDDAIRQQVIDLSVRDMALFALDAVMYTCVMVAVGLVMNYYYLNGAKLRMFVVVLLSQFLIKFLDAFLPMIMPDVASAVVFHALMATAVVYALWIWMTFLRTGRVLIKKDAEPGLGKKKAGSRKGGSAEGKADFRFAGNKKKK